MTNPPKLFISYSHDSQLHQQMVLNLANRFRTEQGVDCQIDQHLMPAYPPEGWMKWMRDKIQEADHVLMLFTPTYRDRYERNVEVGGYGVAFEGLIISEILYGEYSITNKFIPVICDYGSIDDITYGLRGGNNYKVPSDFQTIADLIKGKQYNPLPPLSEISSPQAPTQPTKPASTTSNTTHLSQRDAELVYLQTLLDAADTRFADNNYITLSGGYQADRQRVPEVFMPISFRHHAHKSDETREASGESTHCNDLISAFEQYQRLVILGEPGAGKTFSLWKIAADSATKALNNDAEPVPIVIPLNKWTTTGQPLATFVLEQMGELAPYFDALCQQQRLLPLLDALNEIPFDQREEKLPQVKAWVDQKHPHLLLSCRERDYAGLSVQELDRLDIEPLSPPQVYDFLKKYFAFYNQASTNRQDTADQLFWQLAGGESMKQAWDDWQDNRPEWKVLFSCLAIKRNFYSSRKDYLADISKLINHFSKPYSKPNWKNFWEDKEIEDWYWEQRDLQYDNHARETYFNDSRCLMKLAQNPYLLHLIISIYNNNQQQLPKSRYWLFDTFVSDLLQREVDNQYKAQAKSLIPGQQKLLSNLKQLAWQLQGQTGKDEARTTLTRNEVIENQTMTSEQLSFAAAASLLELTNKTVRYSHQLLQEYFTAQSFEQRIADGLKASQLWLPENWWEPNGWEEAAKLAADYEADPTAFLHWLAEGNPKLAAETAQNQNLLAQKETLFGSYKAVWQAAITNIEHYPHPHERHAISTVLAWLDWDERFGIGVSESGLPNIHWLEVPAGEFIYGEKEERQTLNLDAFEISQFPVTNRQFQAFVEAGGYDNEQWWEGLLKSDELPNHKWTENNRPVERVNWYEAIAFCRWLSAETGRDIRLPTEQQWEKASRGTEGKEYPWGDEYISGYANVDEIWGKDGEFYLPETSAVGLYPQAKSPSEALDMSGNVWEWCLNKYRETEMATPNLSDDDRVLRGGSWGGDTEVCRSSYRNDVHPRYRDYSQGFRLVCCFSPITDH